MIVMMKRGCTEAEVQAVLERVRAFGLDGHVDRGEQTIVGVRGDARRLEPDALMVDGVEQVRRVSARFKEVSREFRPSDTRFTVGSGAGAVELGARPAFAAGPCAVESEAQVFECARAVKAAGADLLRGGAFKPRTSPYTFRGLREEGLRLLVEAGRAVGLPVVSEITAAEQLPAFERLDVDMLQVGARNSKNYDLLERLGKCGRPVLLKRGESSTLEEFLLSAEYLLANGNGRVALCERGIRTFETATRYTFDLNAIAYMRAVSHLPVFADPSHATGRRDLVAPVALGAMAAGAQGLLIEVHPDPEKALSDNAQQLRPAEFARLAERARALSGSLA